MLQLLMRELQQLLTWIASWHLKLTAGKLLQVALLQFQQRRGVSYLILEQVKSLLPHLDGLLALTWVIETSHMEWDPLGELRSIRTTQKHMSCWPFFASSTSWQSSRPKSHGWGSWQQTVSWILKGQTKKGVQ